MIGTEELYSWDGFGAEMSVRHLKRLNEMAETDKKEANPFYQKIDLERTGIVGHSQGGVGVISAITAQPDRHVFKTAVSLSPTNKELSHTLEWDYDAKLIDIPILLISGAGGGDDWVVTEDQLVSIYEDIPSARAKMRRKDTVHNAVLYAPDGYITAWMMWQLQDDQEAAKAFVGDHPEIFSNDLYQDVQTDFGGNE